MLMRTVSVIGLSNAFWHFALHSEYAENRDRDKLTSCTRVCLCFVQFLKTLILEHF